MPIGAAGAAIIAGAASLAGTGAQAYAQGRMNKKTIRFAREMQALQRNQALDDYHMQNEYNSPTAQMQRFRDAGLNPNLIYGQTNEGATVRSSDTPSWNPRTPTWDTLGNAPRASLAAYYDVQLKEAQTDNLTAQNSVYVQDAALRAAQTAATVQSTAKTEFELGQARSLAGISLEAAKADLINKQQSNTIQLNQEERNAAITSSNLKEAAERILEIRARALKTSTDTQTSRLEQDRIRKSIHDLDKNIELKQLDINLKQKGINPSDPMYLRVLGQFLQGLKLPTIQDAENWWQKREQEKQKSTWSNPGR